MKVCIVTIIDYRNYGNRLQNIALITILKNLGCEVLNGLMVIDRRDAYNWIDMNNHVLIAKVKKIIPWIAYKQHLKNQQMRKEKNYVPVVQNRIKNFKLFTDCYTKTFPTIYVKDKKDLCQQINGNSIDYFVVGSDQVWNPCYEAKEYEFLTFAPKEKRLSFAASIGVDNIPEKDKWYFKKNLSNMKYISVREERAAEIVKELTGRIADVTLDPTLLLEKADWEHIVMKPELEIEDHYICTYFLGEAPEAVKAFAKEKGLSIYALNSLDSPELYTLDPAEFLYMIQNASYVLTDSFHAVAFSIKFNKEFYVFDRKQDGVSSMFSRIETITKRFGLENRIQSRDRITEQEPISNWNEIEEELVSEKIRSMGKLVEAMGI